MPGSNRVLAGTPLVLVRCESLMQLLKLALQVVYLIFDLWYYCLSQVFGLLLAQVYFVNLTIDFVMQLVC